jgi:hypothetical protein
MEKMASNDQYLNSLEYIQLRKFDKHVHLAIPYLGLGTYEDTLDYKTG